MNMIESRDLFWLSGRHFELNIGNELLIYKKNYKQNSIVLVGDQFNGFFLLIQALGVDKF